jgi:predicted RND superfamily exporter protein
MIMAKRTIALIFAVCMVVFKGTVAGVSGTLPTDVSTTLLPVAFSIGTEQRWQAMSES